MIDKFITNIALFEESVVIDYVEVTDHPVQRSVSLALPLEGMQQSDPQLWQDIQELLSDARVVLDSAHLAYHAVDRRTQEMGRT